MDNLEVARVFIAGGTVTLNNCDIYSNTAGSGGGVYISNSTVTLDTCNIHNNQATYGGGVYISGTAGSGATVRLYIEKYVPPSGSLHDVVSNVVGDLVAIALDLSDLAKFTGRESPTVIT